MAVGPTRVLAVQHQKVAAAVKAAEAKIDRFLKSPRARREYEKHRCLMYRLDFSIETVFSSAVFYELLRRYRSAGWRCISREGTAKRPILKFVK